MPPSDSGYTVEDLGDSLRITIPSRKNRFGSLASAGLSLVALPMVMLGICALSSASRDDTLTVTLLVLVVVVGLASLFSGVLALMWQSDGKEIIEVSECAVCYQRQSRGLTRKREYRAELVAALHSGPPRHFPYEYEFHQRRVPQNVFQGQAWGMIEISCDGKAHRFGSEVGEAEAEAIVRRIKEKYPRYESSQNSLNGQ